MKQNLIIALAIVALGGVASAEETEQSANTSQIKLEDAKPANQAEQKDIDEEITNARMRATLGSKSKWSVKTAFGYNGGSIERPALEVRPNYRAAKSPDVLTNASGTVGVNYRGIPKGSLSFGTGLVLRNPFHGDLTRSKFVDPRGGNRPTTDRLEVSTPYLSWSNGYKASGMQMATDVSYSHYTTKDATDYDFGMNAVGSFTVSQTVLADLGESSWSAGVSLIASADVYNGDLSETARKQGYAQTSLDYGLYPFAEYSFNDRYSFRTVFGYFESSVYKDDAAGNVQAPVPYQSMGIGMSITRDIYLYPNLQFAPLDIRPERTNVAISANVNMF